MKTLFLGFITVLVLAGCSAQEMKSTVKGWGNDINNAWQNSKDPALDKDTEKKDSEKVDDNGSK